MSLTSRPTDLVSASVCHRALQCAEVLDLILQTFLTWESKPRYQTSRSVALTCRGLFEPASAILWKELPDILPLYSVILNIPEDAVQTSGNWGRHLRESQVSLSELGQLPHPQSEAWQRFLRYGTFVHSIHLLFEQSVRTDLAADLFLLLLEHNQGRPFLSSLRKCTVKSMRGFHPAHLRILASLGSPKVSHLLLRTGIHGDEASRALIEDRIVETIVTAFPALYSLAIQFISEALEHPSRIVADLAALTHLRRLTLACSASPRFGPSELHTLVSAHPRLEYLDALFKEPNMWVPTAAFEGHVLAPSLRRLVCTGQWGVVAEILSILRCPALDELQIALGRSLGPMALVNCDTLSSCVQAIAGPQFAPCLRKLDFEASFERQVFSSRGRPLPPRRTLADILRPLSALEHLEAFSFEMAFSVPIERLTPDLSDEDMHAVARALPRVRYLSLRLEDASSFTSPPTLRSLVHVAACCPHLVDLTLSQLVANVPTPDSTREQELARCDTLRTVHLRDPIWAPEQLEPKELAAFLHRLFPNMDASDCTFSENDTTNALVRDEVRALQACVS